jgi:PAS domain S-box-containing protein
VGSLWLEVDDRGQMLRRSEAVAHLFDAAVPPVGDLTRIVERRVDVRAAIARRAGLFRFGLGRGAARRTYDADVSAGASGARVRLTPVDALGEEAELGRLLLRHAAGTTDAWLVTDPDGIVLWCDATFAWLVGYEREEVLGRPDRLFRSPNVGPRQVDAYWRALFSMGAYRGRSLLRRSDGVDVPVHLSASAIADPEGRTTHYVIVLRDLRAEEEAERLRAIELAVGLLTRVGGDHATQLNDLATEIVGVCEHALLDDDPASAGEALQRVVGIATRLGDLGRRMQALSVGEGAEPPADMGRVARDLAEVLRRAAGPDGPALTVETTPEGPWVGVAPDALVRASIHLALRSLDGVAPGGGVLVQALEEYDEGVLRIRYTPTPTERAALRALQPGGAVTGPVVNELLARAYGAGVDLRIDEARDGSVAISVRAPLVEVVSLRPPARHAPASTARVAIVADDNDSLRELICVTLGGLFEEAVGVRDGAEALEALRARGASVDLVVLDLRMPHGGLELLRAVLAEQPDTRVLVVTGAGPEGTTRAALAAGARAVLTKPFHLHELRAVARGVMAGAEW